LKPAAGRRPRILVTGFGPFPNAPENPSEVLARELAGEPPERLGASALRAFVLPTDYRRSWPALRRVQDRFAPDIVVHFGLARRADSLVLEQVARKRVHAGRPDAAGFAPPSGLARRSGPEMLSATLPLEAIQAALHDARFPVALSEDAGDYVCNATLYRSLAAAAGGRRVVGFIHIPPTGAGGMTRERLLEAARLILATAGSAWMDDRSPSEPVNNAFTTSPGRRDQAGAFGISLKSNAGPEDA
jgi:pyroglutamyl-peptidase